MIYEFLELTWVPAAGEILIEDISGGSYMQVGVEGYHVTLRDLGTQGWSIASVTVQPDRKIFWMQRVRQ